MSRKSKRNQPRQERPEPQAQQVPQPRRINRRSLFIGSVVVLLLAFVAGTLLYQTEKAKSAQYAADRNRPALASEHSPTLGKADARVHIVEFLDPACETCASFYPHVKKLMAANPDRIRLSVRHVPFHKGSDPVVRILEAARNQGKYWEALEAALRSQDRWVVNHEAHAERVWVPLGSSGLDLGQARSDMNAPEISRRIEQDLGDARALGVTKTPEFFVNGRAMPSFGLKELQNLVAEELQRAYP
jgi:protein-disulfide isomerase